MRIVAGAFRGRTLAAPPGATTRPTADRVRQALFDALSHAPWGGRDVMEEARVLDVFAGTGALGLEALSRGAAHATFLERDAAALRTLRANVAACRAEACSTVLAGDALRPPPAGRGHQAEAERGCGLVFLDPPYGADLVAAAVAALARAGWLAEGALLVAELGRDEPLPALPATLLDDRAHGAARVTVWRRNAP